ncbi:hypothetical protein CMU93_02465 [Elizabethkingia anophelis]|nr:hypothetical protein [Elizabethkingia anophelis]
MKILTLFLLSFMFILSSCKNECDNTKSEIRGIMKAWYKKKIEFPSNMEILTNNLTSDHQNIEKALTTKRRYTIVHFFTADCDKCVNELKIIQSGLKNMPKNKDVDYIFIASAPTNTYVLDAIKKTNFPYPIYYEQQYFSFKTINKFVLLDDIYNTMLLDKNQNLILFGAFYDNDKAKRLYSKTIECRL